MAGVAPAVPRPRSPAAAACVVVVLLLACGVGATAALDATCPGDRAVLEQLRSELGGLGQAWPAQDEPCLSPWQGVDCAWTGDCGATSTGNASSSGRGWVVRALDLTPLAPGIASGTVLPAAVADLRSLDLLNASWLGLRCVGAGGLPPPGHSNVGEDGLNCSSLRPGMLWDDACRRRGLLLPGLSAGRALWLVAAAWGGSCGVLYADVQGCQGPMAQPARRGQGQSAADDAPGPSLLPAPPPRPVVPACHPNPHGPWNPRGSIPAALSLLQRLHVLDVSHNALTGTIPDGLAALPRLEDCLLASNQLGGQLGGAWCGSPVVVLDVRQNALLTGPLEDWPRCACGTGPWPFSYSSSGSGSLGDPRN